MDAPRDFLIFLFYYVYFFSERAARGGGGCAARLFFFFFFPCSADHERDWPPCKVFFFGLATNALNVRNNNNNNKPLSYREVLERTGSERIETTIRKRQLGFAGALVRQGDSRLIKRVMFGRLAVQGPKRGGRPATSWVDCLQKNIEAFGAVPRKGKGRKWVAFGVVVKDGRDWMTAAKNMGKWHRGVERGAEALDSAWRRADLRQSNVQLQREVSEVVQ